MKYIVKKEFEEDYPDYYQEGDIIEVEVNYIENICVIFEEGTVWYTFSKEDLDMYFISVADWREAQINSIFKDE